MASYDKALELQPDFKLAQENRRIALKKLNSPLNILKSWVKEWFWSK
ncbi:MAG: hypothetical protein F6K30_05010 [Cyanothece sp. SIO2G6]|nr:hypothetical protein [Cyanothece sp. SIO2G6]